ncbi:MAG: hypothetical protein AB7K67_04240 [Hyphomicrobiaceae bacterium]|jgi:hypothetical protein
MARETGKPTPGKAGPDDRRERLAAALRDNLRKRKAQSRAREERTADGTGAGGEGETG